LDVRNNFPLISCDIATYRDVFSWVLVVIFLILRLYWLVLGEVCWVMVVPLPGFIRIRCTLRQLRMSARLGGWRLRLRILKGRIVS
jgi:hypothetical protein